MGRCPKIGGSTLENCDNTALCNAASVNENPALGPVSMPGGNSSRCKCTYCNKVPTVLKS